MATMQKTATWVKDLPDWRGDAVCYKFDPPLSDSWDEEEGGVWDYAIVSAVTLDYGTVPMSRELRDSLPSCETYIFPADENGECISMAELPGSQKNTRSHAQVLGEIGYTIINKEEAQKLEEERRRREIPVYLGQRKVRTKK